MLFVGDILQLPPVNGAPVFQSVPTKVLSLRIGCIGSANIWKSTVVYDELTINERQKGDKLYTEILDGVRRGYPSEQAVSLLTERVFDVAVLEKYEQLKREGKKPICLFSTRKACATVNSDLLNTLDSKIIPLRCRDVIDEGACANGEWNKQAEKRLTEMNKDSSLTAGLEEVLHLAVNARVMLRRNLSTEDGLVNGAIGTVLEIESKHVTVKFDRVAEPYKVTRVANRFCVLYISRNQFPLIVAYAVTIHKSQGLSLDCAIIDLSDSVFGEGMAYVALSRVRSIDGVHLTSFTPHSIMASRTCVEECNRLRLAFRPDLAAYELPVKQNRKRKMTAAIVPPAKRQCTVEGSNVDKPPVKKRKERTPAVFPPAKRQCNLERKVPSNVDKPPVKKLNEAVTSAGDCHIVEDPENRGSNHGESFCFNPLDEVEQKSACLLLKINHRRNIVTAGGPNIALTRPHLPSLVDTMGDGACMFRAMSVVITGYQRQHITVRRAIVKHMCDFQHLFNGKHWLIDAGYPDMISYVRATQMDQTRTWGTHLEIFALAHLLERRVFVYSRTAGNAWLCHCPSKIDPNIPPPRDKKGLYIYHTGDHYKVVTSVTK
ncbi:ATP-dependent DNA helicase PIF6-like [Halichondria panicea]|uniref:ATP-dependent DNA helicase PIF6-like n=1 Tax=Halichondria panicea TaxID=6063 RepID=UPI00312B3660